jgi:hypothetical protein
MYTQGEKLSDDHALESLQTMSTTKLLINLCSIYAY